MQLFGNWLMGENFRRKNRGGGGGSVSLRVKIVLTALNIR